MLIHSKDKQFITGRAYPKLVLLKTSVHADGLHLDKEGMDTLVLPINPMIEKSQLIDIV